jgi:hypothetical protein
MQLGSFYAPSLSGFGVNYGVSGIAGGQVHLHASMYPIGDREDNVRGSGANGCHEQGHATNRSIEGKNGNIIQQYREAY